MESFLIGFIAVGIIQIVALLFHIVTTDSRDQRLVAISALMGWGSAILFATVG